MSEKIELYWAAGLMVVFGIICFLIPLKLIVVPGVQAINRAELLYREVQTENFLLRAELADKKAQLKLIRERDARTAEAIASGRYLPLPLPDRKYK